MQYKTLVAPLITFLYLDLSESMRLDIYHTTTVLDHLMLGCGHEVESHRKWTYFEQVIYLLDIAVDSRFTRNSLLIKNYSMLITDISLFHEGIYKCVRGENFEVYRHHVEVQECYEF
ncbi:hypothetical protein HOLleu_44730 [Holothuria leucospilota]|uniref:Uncharacterized protein n=1 Tax=Holothuria leucospilota TaxID=206669 RepID=A0A9Q1BAQ7_HOLLE|nr:hypothetical protein HOLleu_44730 [Holothuria leucospilota]